MSGRCGIDTTILVRLLTGDPPADFAATLSVLHTLMDEGATFVASNQVIAEAYVAVQHHYGVTKAEARAALLSVLQSGLVAPQNGAGVIAALEATTGCGLATWLIDDDYTCHDIITITLDDPGAAPPDGAWN